MMTKERIVNSLSVRVGKFLSWFFPLRLIWLQDKLITDVLGALINEKINSVVIEKCADAECWSFPQSMSAFEKGCCEVSFPDAYLVRIDNAYLSPMSGLCWRKNEYFTQSVGSVTSCFGYRTAFRQISTRRLGKCQVVEIGVVIVNTQNISHFLLEDLPCLIEIAHRGIPATVVIKTTALKSIMEILDKLFSNVFSVLSCDSIVRARTCYFITRSEEPPFFRKKYSNLLRSFVLDNTALDELSISNVRGGQKVYISRRKSAIRAIENEIQLEECLVSFGFNIVYLEDLSFSEQVQSIKNARIIVGLHGAGLTQELWAAPGCHIIEIFPLGYYNAVFELLALSLGFSYEKAYCESSDKNPYGRVSVRRIAELLEYR